MRISTSFAASAKACIARNNGRPAQLFKMLFVGYQFGGRSELRLTDAELDASSMPSRMPNCTLSASWPYRSVPGARFTELPKAPIRQDTKDRTPKKTGGSSAVYFEPENLARKTLNMGDHIGDRLLRTAIQHPAVLSVEQRVLNP